MQNEDFGFFRIERTLVKLNLITYKAQPVAMHKLKDGLRGLNLFFFFKTWRQIEVCAI